jgi:hypothetical protein
MQDLVPCVLLSFDNEQILMFRGKEWKSRYPKPLTLIPKIRKNNVPMSSDESSSGVYPQLSTLITSETGENFQAVIITTI